MKVLGVLILVLVATQCVPEESFRHLPSRFPVLDTAQRRPAKGFREKRSVHSRIAHHGQFPYQAGLLMDESVFCGGSVIAAEWILTAGHCVYDAIRVTIYLGSQNRHLKQELGRVVFESREFILHSNFSCDYELRNDIALIKLPEPVFFNEYIATIKLASAGFNYVGETAVVSGWGRKSDAMLSITSQLRYIEVPIIKNAECLEHFGSRLVSAGTLCAGAPHHRSICHGDSGGPLVVNGTQIGIVSFVTSYGCDLGYPTGYTSVMYFRDWIYENTGIEL